MFKGSDGGLHERREERDEQIMVSLCLRGHAMLRRTRRALPRSDHAGRRRQPSAKGFVQSPSTSSSTTHPRPFHTLTAVGLQLLLSAQHAAHHSYCISPSGRDAHSCCTLCSRTRVVSICASLSPRCVAWHPLPSSSKPLFYCGPAALYSSMRLPFACLVYFPDIHTCLRNFLCVTPLLALSYQPIVFARNPLPRQSPL